MSRKSRYFFVKLSEWILIGSLVLSSLFLAIVILYSELSYIPGLTSIESITNNQNQVTSIESITDNQNQVQTTVINSFTVTGVQARIDFSQIDQIENLWSQFSNTTELHNNLDWTQQHTVIAIYHQIDDSLQTANLSIGYPTEQLLRPIKFPNFHVPAGEYRHYELPDIKNETVARVWNQIMSDPTPQIIIERYGLDSSGNTRRIQIQTLK